MSSKRSALLTIFLIVFVDVLGFTIILPLLPFYSESLGATPFVVGLLVSAYGFCQLIAGPVLGQISDRIGRRPVLILSQFGTLLGFLLLGFSFKLWMIFLARIIDGITAGNITVAQAYISDVTEPKERTKAMGTIGAAFGLGFLMGPAISGILAQYGHSMPIWAACFLSFLSICGTFFFLKEAPKEKMAEQPKKKRKQKYGELLQQENVRYYYFAYFAFAVSFATFTSGLALFCERRLEWHGHPFQATQVGYLLALSGGINLLVQTTLIGRLVKKFREESLVQFGFFSGMCGLFLLGCTTNLTFCLVGVCMNSFGSALLRPCLTGLISRNVSPQHQGFALGFGQTLFSVAQIICPLLSGAFITAGWYFGYTSAASLASFSGFLTAAIFFSEKRRLKRANAEVVPNFTN